MKIRCIDTDAIEPDLNYNFCLFVRLRKLSDYCGELASQHILRVTKRCRAVFWLILADWILP